MEIYDIMDTQPIHLNIMFSPRYAVPVFGYAVPPIAAVVVIVNAVMAKVLLKKTMRNGANQLLLCMAISDTAAILFPVVPFVYFYTLGHYEEFVPFPWCRAFYLLVHVLPLLCNMASLWTTVALASMRCYSVWKPLKTRSLFTPFRTNMAIVAIYILSIVVYIPPVFEYSYNEISAPSLVETNTTITSCHMRKSQSHLMTAFCDAHTWIQIIFTSLLPWFLITFPDAGLLWKLKQADDNRHQLQDGTDRPVDNGAHESLMSARSRQTNQRRKMTWIIFLVVSMVWLVEIPFAISFTKHLAHTHGDVMRQQIGTSVVFVFLLKYITYPIIFVIYCFMSQRFRRTFKGVVLRKTSESSSQVQSSKIHSSTKSSEKRVDTAE